MMGIISYAQNFEDVLLWRALGHIQQGCYIDIGAHDPIVDSVSKAFYERGWRGIHVEPLPVYCDALRRDRPDETVLQAAVASETGILRFFEIPDTGISTGDEAIAQSHRERGFRINEITVPCVTLAQVFQLVKGDVVHWLKIDVEGLEDQVLQGWGESSLRPWIVVVESILPFTQDEVFSAWEGLLLEKGYRCVHFDGLNRYYLAKEQSALESVFRSGPNVFDGFQFNGTANNPFCGHVAESIRNQLGGQIESLKQQVLQYQTGEQGYATRLAEEHTRSESLKLAVQAEQTDNLQNQKVAQALALQAEQQARQEIEAQLRHAMQREQEFTAQLLASKDQLQQLEQAHSAREKQLQEQLTQARQETEAQLRHAMQREQEFTAQLLAGKDQLQQLEQAHSAREKQLQEQLTQAEQQARQESEAHLRNAVEREQAAAVQLLELQQQAAQALAQQVRELQSQHDERTLAWDTLEKTFRQEISNLANEVQALRYASELQTQQYGFAMDAHVSEHQRLIEAYEALESRFKAEIAAEQQTSLHLHQSLADVLIQLEKANQIAHVRQTELGEQVQLLTCMTEELSVIRQTRSWRWTAPLRQLVSYLHEIVDDKSLKRFKLLNSKDQFNTSEEINTKIPVFVFYNNLTGDFKHSDSVHRGSSVISGYEKEDKEIIVNLGELLSLPGVEFVRIAYRILLGREADEIGLQHYVRRLTYGCGKVSVLFDLAQSTEARALSGHEDLMSFSDDNFIDAIYQRILHRDADSVGKNHYLSALKKHGDRRRIIQDIENSPETKKCNCATLNFKKDLAELLHDEQLARSWRGWWKRRGRVERRLAVLEERIADSRHLSNIILSSVDDLNCRIGNLASLTEMTKIVSRLDELTSAIAHLSTNASFSAPDGAANSGQLDGGLGDLQHDEILTGSGLALENRIVRDNKRILLFYVEHTAIFDRITGIQRVCHKLSAMLESCGEKLILVKLDHSTLDFEPLNKDERRHFFIQSGRLIDDQDDDQYDPVVFRQLIAALRAQSIHSWLIIPEVTYHTTHRLPPTSRLIKLSRDYGLKVGVIFYDVIPFLSNDAVENAHKHANYMSTIALADIIWPISNYSADLLVDYYRRYEKLNSAEMPLISVNCLAEEMDTPRQIHPGPSIGRNIVCVGTIDERKNQISLVRAFNKYCDNHPGTEWKLHVIGLVRDSYKKTIEMEASRNPNIEFHYNASDEDIKLFYTNCDFTVFPSLEEGYGLPVVESLWNIRPCICASFSSMADLQINGGCIAIDTHNVDAIFSAITDLIENKGLYQKLVNEIMQRKAKTWYEYAAEIVADMDKHQFGKQYDGIIYYWVDATLAATGNTGIQRVNRQLAKQLILQGHKLVPIKWDEQNECVCMVTEDDLNYLALWNGPAVKGWQLSAGLDLVGTNATYLMVDLPLNRSLDIQRRVIDFFKRKSVQCAAIFYDAIPHKLAKLYPPHFSSAHKEYMELLDRMDLVMPISATSANDLLNFLNTSHCRALSIEERTKTVDLPSEFPEIARSLNRKPTLTSECCRILVVGTVEPRKNHATLIRAFFDAEAKSSRKLALTLVGGDESFDKELPKVISGLIGDAKNINWIKKASDDVLRQQYDEADFTVFPSYEEGFGLPIVESLWFGVPCVCADFGQMGELAAEGGCLAVDVRSVEDLSNAIVGLANNSENLNQLRAEILHRYFKTWDEYAAEVSSCLRAIVQNPNISTEEVTDMAPYTLSCRPVLSVCITTYNRAGWLEINLENLMQISEKLRDRIEIVVCDNCSSDETPEVVVRFIGGENFSYFRNSGNIGMLGNLPQTVSLARGDYVWLIGDDDLIHDDALERILGVIENVQPELINLNYAYSVSPEPPTPDNLESYFNSATKICEGDDSGPALVKEISAFNENFYTAIYTFVVRRKHAQRIYTQDTSGAPFSSLQTCVPSSKYILSKLMELPGYWINEPVITINMHVSWGKYAPLWILERVPEVYDLAELNGVAKEQVERWRKHTFQMIPAYLNILFESEYDASFCSFDLLKFIRRIRHLSEFRNNATQFEEVYEKAFANHHQLAKVPLNTMKAAML